LKTCFLEQLTDRSVGEILSLAGGVVNRPARIAKNIAASDRIQTLH